MVAWVVGGSAFGFGKRFDGCILSMIEAAWRLVMKDARSNSSAGV